MNNSHTQPTPISEIIGPRAEQIERYPFDYQNGLVSAQSPKGAVDVKENLVGEVVFLSNLDYDDHKIEWVWEGFLAKGYITLISAWPKTGKTTLLAHFLEAQDRGDDSFLQHELKSTRTLVLSEESHGLWVARREGFNFSGERVLLNAGPMARRLGNATWEQYLIQLVEVCKQHSVELVVFDTLASFWPVTEENSSGNVGLSLRPLRHLTNAGLSVLLVHHERKSGGEYGAEARGSNAITAYVDILVNLKRPKNGSAHTRVITTMSRLADAPENLTIELVDDEYIVKEGLSPQFESNFSSVLEHIPVFPESISQKELQAKLKNTGESPSGPTLHRWLKKASEKKMVVLQKVANTRGNPSFWSRPAQTEEVT